MDKILDGLRNINVDEEIARLEKEIPAETSMTRADKKISQLKVLRSLKAQGLNPYEAFTKSIVPVIPAQYRAPIQTTDGKTLIPEVNLLIRNVARASDLYDSGKTVLPDEEVRRLRKNVYKTLEDLSGFETPKTQKGIEKNYWNTVSGTGSPKGGMFQSKVIRKRQDLSGRGVIIPNPQLDIDEISVPRHLGYEMYKPFVVRELVGRGYGAYEAKKMVEDDNELAKEALIHVGKHRPMFINRAPSVWSTSVTAHYPIFTDGEVIGIPNLTAPQLLGDFDGDSCLCEVEISLSWCWIDRLKYMLTNLTTKTVRDINNTFLSRLIDTIKLVSQRKTTVFIGNILHCPVPFDAKPNEWGGVNYKYRVMPGQKVMSLNDKDRQNHYTEWDEIRYLSKHTNIPAYRVTVDGSYQIICSPKNSILIMFGGNLVKANLMKDDIVGGCTPTHKDGGGGIYYGTITGVEKLDVAMDMYDLTLMNNEIFLADKHLYVYDTVAMHVPVTNEAIRDVENMLASKNLVFEANNKLTTSPQHSAMIGLYQLSQTKPGRDKINDVLPEKYHVKSEINQRDVNRIIKDVSTDPEHKDKVAQVVSQLRRIGDNHATETGYTLGLSDVEPLTGRRDKVVKDIREKLSKMPEEERYIKSLELYKEQAGRVEASLKEIIGGTKSSLKDSVFSGGRGSLSQIRDLVFAPLMTKGNEGTVEPIEHSYAEGITPSEYALTAKSARHGSKGRSQMTSLPGALAKEIQSTASLAVIKDTINDQMQSKVVPIDDIDDLLDRYTSADVKNKAGDVIIPKNTPITTAELKDAIKNRVDNIPVYTVLGSSGKDGTIPSYAYGLAKDGKPHDTGFNIGALSALGLVNPLFQSSMQSFHTGAAITDKYVGYPRIKQILEMTKHVPHKAVIAHNPGSITSIAKDDLGGHYIYIDGESHYMQPGNRLLPKYKEGSFVDKGDIISDGPADLRELYDYTNLDTVRTYMVDELKQQVPGVRKRNIEVIVEAITRYGEVINPGNTKFLKGDVALISEIEEANKSGDAPATYRAIMKGVNTLPQATQDWLSQLGFRNLKRVMSDAVAQGKVSDIHAYSPIPGMAYGVEFGLGEEGKY